MCALSRAQKTEWVQTYQTSLRDCKMAFLLEYQGSKMADLESLRGQLRKSGSTMMVIKNRLLKKAIEKSPFAKFDAHLEGPLALVSSSGDIVAPVKVVYPLLSAEEKKFKLRAAISVESPEILTYEQFSTLAKLPSREEMMGKIMGSMLVPVRNLMGVLTAVPRNLVYLLSQVSQKEEKT